MDLQLAILRITFIVIFGIKMLAFGYAVGQDERKCKYLRVDKMLKIRCYGMDLKEVPQNLKTSVEVLDLSFNRIKKLKRISFEQYTSVKYLLLYENMIQSVEPGTFKHLRSLQEVDLSSNALVTIPVELFQLPSLRNLYVDSNELLHLDLEALETPIRAPLEYLNVADCALTDLPDLGPLPKLWHINASSNPLTNLNFERFANMCNLKSIDLMKTSLNDCNCQQINGHLRSIGVQTKFVPVCMESLDESVCPPPYNQTHFSETFDVCKHTRPVQEASLWLIIAGGCACFLLVFTVIWCCLRNRKRKRIRKIKSSQSRKPFAITPTNAKTYHDNHNYNNKPIHEDELLRCDTA